MELAKYIQRLNAIADAGLVYAKDEFDRERYQDMKNVLAELSGDTGLKVDETAEMLRPTNWYPTPLIDVRAFICNELDEVMLVKDKRNGEWALPGGYAEVGISPSENVLKELFEEVGVVGEVERLLAIFDTNKHQFQSRQYYKMVFVCSVTTQNFHANNETVKMAYFSIDNLPELSNLRNTKLQIQQLFEAYETGTQIVE